MPIKFSGQPNLIEPKVGDILLDKNGKYHRLVTYCRYAERAETLFVFESLVDRSVLAKPISQLTEDNFTIAIKSADLEWF
jgi:hypothetical protein